MKYAVLFEDNDEFAHMRPQYMPDHLRFLGENADRIDAAGPLADAASGAAAGGLWIVEAQDAAEVRALVEADPFFPTGLRKEIRILEWKRVFADGAQLI